MDHHMADLPETIDSLDSVTPRYKALLCDVWGVVHNGVTHFPAATAALQRARAAGLAVVLITNSPRRSADVIAQMRGLGVPDGSFDRVVSSGDVTRDLIAEGPRKVLHIGPDRDFNLYDGLDVELVEEFEADGVVCTGLFDDEVETPADYAELLQRLRARNLPFICANPDIVVERGERLIWCAGALARDYAQMGGRTLIAGKPHAPIYRAAMKAAAEVLGRGVTVENHWDPIVAAARPPLLQAMFDYYDLHGICGNGTVLAALLHRPPTTWRAWVETHR